MMLSHIFPWGQTGWVRRWEDPRSPSRGAKQHSRLVDLEEARGARERGLKVGRPPSSSLGPRLDLADLRVVALGWTLDLKAGL